MLTHNINKEGEDFFVGDIQGHYTLLINQLKQLNFNFDIDRLFCTGDIVDKGPESEKCINLLTKPWFFSCLGNHDLSFIESCNNESIKKAYHSGDGGWSKELFNSIEKINGLALLMKLKMPLCRLVKQRNGVVGVAHAGFPDDLIHIKSLYYHGPVTHLIKATNCRALFSDLKASFDIVDTLVLGHNSVDKAFRVNNIAWIDTIHTGQLTVIKACDLINIPFEDKGD